MKLKHFTIVMAAIGLMACSPDISRNSLQGLEPTGIMGGIRFESMTDLRSTSVILMTWDKNEGIVGFCSATLIGKKTILTAAHCGKISLGQTLIVVFDNSLESGKIKNVRVVTHFTPHPKYTGYEIRSPYDIAVARFHGDPVPKGFKIRDLPKNFSIKGDRLVLAGAGRYFPDITTTARLRSLRLGFERIWDESSTHVLLDQLNQQGACLGDSGGPLYVEKGKALTLVGVLSYVYSAAGMCTVSAYVKIAPHLPWIRSAMDSMAKK